MNLLLTALSLTFGLIPFNRCKKESNFLLDYAVMLAMPILYLGCYFMANFGTFGVYQLPTCDSICRLSNTLFMHLGSFMYLTIALLTLWRRKNFYWEFEERLRDIDELVKKCQKLGDIKQPVPPSKFFLYVAWTLICGVFLYAFFYDVTKMSTYYHEYFFVVVMVTTFPFFAGSIVQAQFIYFVSIISRRFTQINELFEKISKECERKNAPLKVFDIESDVKKTKHMKEPIVITEVPTEKDELDFNSSDDDEGFVGEKSSVRATDGPTTENNLPDLFKLHDKVLALSVLTNSEFGAQCVPYMATCFVICIFGIFLETKVIFIVGGKNPLLDYVAFMFIIWSLTTIFVAYMVLRLCCKANSHSKQSVMIIHEIMQKKPAFMLGNDLYYNKMKSFTLQFLHWEGFFHFNGIGLFALDYTFIFSTVSAATSYLIVLLQFDMSSILKSEGLVD